MPIAAVPRYLGTDFSDASPGMRFGMYLPVWTTRQDQEHDVRKRAQARSKEGQEVNQMLNQQGMDATIESLQKRERRPLAGLWSKNDFAAKKAWQEITRLTRNDRNSIDAQRTRQTEIAATIDETSLFIQDAQSIAPFVTGMGNEHPLENGFSFLNPYGLPYLPGSGVKGVLRQAARELASGEWGNTDGDTEDSTEGNTKGWSSQAIDLLFGKETADGDSETLRGVLSFWDVIPQIAGNELLVEIMTPHQSGYYQKGDTPHDSGQPNPISFLTVPPQSQFAFYVVCDTTRLRALAANSRNDSLYSAAEAKRLLKTIEDNGGDNSTVWKQLLQHAFEHAFQWLGFGAKTSVGYGEMLSANRKKQIEEVQREREEQQQLENAEIWEKARAKYNRGAGTLIVEKNGRSMAAPKEKSEELLASLPPKTAQKIKTNQFVRITAHVSQNDVLRVEAE